MREPNQSRQAPTVQPNSAPTKLGPSVDSEITWLLHRAAQRMGQATGQQADKHGLQLRDHIILSALVMRPGDTQGELSRTLGLDKTTLTSQLDRLEAMGLVTRKTDPRDRRARVPEITAAGRAARQAVARACNRVEADALSGFTEAQVRAFRTVLFGIIGDSDDPGSCL